MAELLTTTLITGGFILALGTEPLVTLLAVHTIYAPSATEHLVASFTVVESRLAHFAAFEISAFSAHCLVVTTFGTE
jgi:hypothetical protein